MSADRAGFRDAVTQSAREIAAGMLRFRDEQQVLEDLEPAAIDVQPAALADARRAMVLARETEPDVAVTFALNAIPRTVDALDNQLPTFFDELLTKAPADQAVRLADDFVVCLTFVQLLPVFEATAAESPRTSSDVLDSLTAVKTYFATADMLIEQVGGAWAAFRADLRQQGVDDWRRFSPEMLAGGLREVFDIAFAGRHRFAAIDARVLPDGEVGARNWFAAEHASGIVRTASGTMATWQDGLPAGGHESLEAAFAAVGLFLLGQG